MDYKQWQHKRSMLMERERSERAENWQQSRAPIQAAVTEQAIRELYDKVATLEAWVDSKRSNLRDAVVIEPKPKEKAEARS